MYGSVTLPPGNYTELGFVQAFDQHLNAAAKVAIRAQYDSTNNVCGLYATGDNVAFLNIYRRRGSTAV